MSYEGDRVRVWLAMGRRWEVEIRCDCTGDWREKLDVNLTDGMGGTHADAVRALEAHIADAQQALAWLRERECDTPG